MEWNSVHSSGPNIRLDALLVGVLQRTQVVALDHARRRPLWDRGEVDAEETTHQDSDTGDQPSLVTYSIP